VSTWFILQDNKETDQNAVLNQGEMMKMKKMCVIVLLTLFYIFQSVESYTQNENLVVKDAVALSDLEDHFTFMIASDLGRNGYYDQKPVAEMMGEVADIVEPEFVAALGDVHHFMGIRSVQDPLWETNFEWIYKHPELMITWHPVLGNHEYMGNSQAFLDYSNISRRWEMPDRYYAVAWAVSEKVDALMLFIDTPPLIDKYRKNPEDFEDAGKQSVDRQLAWIDSTLSASTAKWKVIMGHHPIYAGTTKSESERRDLQIRLKPLLDKHDVDMSVCGHIHNFQHIRVPQSGVDYFVNTSASLTRKVVEIEGALFGSPDPGFSLCTIKENAMIMTFVNDKGEIIYQYSREK
jgi:hypothetical protein